ncbi:MAG: SUF system NifU family Fe-S cluster assembly protein [Candidatus Omnitrophica bacterium]|nr:SUF system NifU family Fe-S cluster assembly protein [Candidatus Omnitrophota bacterium]
MSEINELYQDLILDHTKKPRNFEVLEGASRHVEGYNPLCGDRYTIYVRMEGDVIRDVSFQGSGCAISKSSASMMTTIVKGKTKCEAEAIFENFHKMITGQSGVDKNKIGKLEVFHGVSEFPVRVKCASLAWHTLKAALGGEEKTITTE